MKARNVLGLLALGGLIFVSGSAQAQSSRDIINRLSRLENEIETLNRAVYKGDVSPSASASYTPSASPRAQADLEVRLQQLETEMRDLRGLIEEQNHSTRQLQTQLEKFSGDVEIRLGDLERGTGPIAGTTYGGQTGQVVEVPVTDTQTSSALSAASGDMAPPPGQTAQELVQLNMERQAGTPAQSSLSLSDDRAAAVYENAFSLLKNEQYEAAGQEFQAFLTAYPQHVLAGNAKYWLGEAYYVRGNYDQAARIFAEGYKQYPKSAKTPDNLLKLGLSLASLGSKDDACVALKELKSQYGQTQTPVIRRADQEMASLGCS